MLKLKYALVLLYLNYGLVIRRNTNLSFLSLKASLKGYRMKLSGLYQEVDEINESVNPIYHDL